MDTFTLAAVLLIITGAMNAQELVPLNATVLQNSDVRFNCSVTRPGWSLMTWTVNERLVLSISETSGLTATSARYSATNFSTAGEYKWEFLIKGVTLAEAGKVGCQVLNSLTVYATLTVQQNGAVEIIGSNRTSTEGDQVTFQCQAKGWLPEAQLSWKMNGVPVDKVLYNSSSETNGNLINSNSTLKITAKSNVSVDCLASISTLPSPEIRTVFLTVKKAVTPPPKDQTVLIAITVAFSLAALLALIIIGIIFFCKRRRRKRSTYRDELRAHSQSYRQQAAYTERGRGRVHENFGYIAESPIVDNRDSVYTIDGFRRGNYINNVQLSDVNSIQYTDSSAYNGYSLEDPGFQKHRHLTLV